MKAFIEKLMDQVERLQATLSRQPKATLAGVVMALLVICWFVYVPPLEAIRRSADDAKRMEAERVQAQAVLARVRSGTVPSLRRPEDASDILSELNAQARAHQLQVLQVSPGVPSPMGDGLLMFPVEFMIEGNYREMGEFIGSLRQTRSLGAVCVRRISIGREAAILPRLRAYVTINIALGSSS